MTTIPMKEVAAFLLGEDSLDGYWFGERHPISPFWWREHLRAALSAPATAPEPSWQDAPTCAGLWFCDEGDENPYRFTCHNVSIPLNPYLVGEGERWYGPIPPDGDKP